MNENQNSAEGGGCPLLEAEGLVKIYGHTVAVDKFRISINKGETIGLLGGNGAGKSTLTRIISGVTVPDEGSMTFDGEDIKFGHFNPSGANNIGIRVVYQELSLCTNLRVYENFYIELRGIFKGDMFWRSNAAKMAHAMLEEIFPGSGINVDVRLDTLTIAQMQMVEIARTFCDPNLKLLILDEPTSSLAAEQTEMLMSYIRKKSADGVSFVFITHRLKEAIALADRIYVAQNGICKWIGLVGETNEDDLIERMGGDAKKTAGGSKTESAEKRSINEKVGIKVDSLTLGSGAPISFDLSGGEIIGVGGLEGNGQRELLRRLFSLRNKKNKNVQVTGTVAYVTGDRKKEGNFPLWSTLENMMITKLSFGRLSAITSEKGLVSSAANWYEKLKIKGEGYRSGILSLSGGNQQKVLIARSMVADADIIILDDPTRGVDIATKHQLYDIFTELAEAGKLVIWYSSDDMELEYCSRVFVMRYNTVITELSGPDISKDAIVENSFRGEELKPTSRSAAKEASKSAPAFVNRLMTSGAMVPFIAMVLVYVLCGLLSKKVFTWFGVELLLSGAAPLIFLALGQMLVIGFSQIDLGIGYFMGFINVLSATLLTEKPVFGALVIIGLVLLYGCMGLVIYYRSIPPIIMTMGASFIWRGAAITIMPAPGGMAPDWLTSVFWSDSVLPPALIIILIITVVMYLFYRSKYGTVMKGFGNNAASMVRSGWSEPVVYYLTYLSAGVLAMLGGLVMSGISGAADANAAGPYTMLTIASVVMGGGHLMGGLVTVQGCVFGAITFSLISSLLGFMSVSTELTAAVQGLILVGILSMRLVKRGGVKA